MAKPGSATSRDSKQHALASVRTAPHCDGGRPCRERPPGHDHARGDVLQSSRDMAARAVGQRPSGWPPRAAALWWRLLEHGHAPTSVECIAFAMNNRTMALPTPSPLTIHPTRRPCSIVRLVCHDAQPPAQGAAVR